MRGQGKPFPFLVQIVGHGKAIGKIKVSPVSPFLPNNSKNLCRVLAEQTGDDCTEVEQDWRLCVLRGRSAPAPGSTKASLSMGLLLANNCSFPKLPLGEVLCSAWLQTAPAECKQKRPKATPGFMLPALNLN